MRSRRTTPAGVTALSPSPARVRGTIAAAVAQPDDLRQLRAFHKVMADVNRLRIVRRLAHGEATSPSSSRMSGCRSRSCPGISAGSAALASSRHAGVAARRSAACARRHSHEFAARERAVLGVTG